MGNAARGLLIASLIFGVSYPLTWGLDLPPTVETAWKGAGVALLALYAGAVARERDGWLLAAVLGLGALGDVLLESSMTAGAIAFMAGHVIAITLYLRNRRVSPSASQRALAVLVVPLSVFVAWVLPTDRGAAAGVAVYALFVAVMAACAWMSSFPRYRVGIGAMMFLASDLVIFARMGPAEDASWPSFAIWPLYYAGQLLICMGVSGMLRRRHA